MQRHCNDIATTLQRHCNDIATTNGLPSPPESKTTKRMPGTGPRFCFLELDFVDCSQRELEAGWPGVALGCFAAWACAVLMPRSCAVAVLVVMVRVSGACCRRRVRAEPHT
eukprot:3164342-Rhodomonas_salina.2